MMYTVNWICKSWKPMKLLIQFWFFLNLIENKTNIKSWWAEKSALGKSEVTDFERALGKILHFMIDMEIKTDMIDRYGNKGGDNIGYCK